MPVCLNSVTLALLISPFDVVGVKNYRAGCHDQFALSEAKLTLNYSPLCLNISPFTQCSHGPLSHLAFTTSP